MLCLFFSVVFSNRRTSIGNALLLVRSTSPACLNVVKTRMWEYFILKRAEVKKILEDVSREKLEGIQGHWGQSKEMRMWCAQMMRQGYFARSYGSWEEFKERCTAPVFLWKTRRSTAVGGVRYVEAKYEWRAPNRILVVRLGTDATEAKLFRAHAAPQGLCEILSMRSDGDSSIQSIATGLQKKK